MKCHILFMKALEKQNGEMVALVIHTSPSHFTIPINYTQQKITSEQTWYMNITTMIKIYSDKNATKPLMLTYKINTNSI